jgi:glycosyltransferase involved in cell wall biosynthesis
MPEVAADAAHIVDPFKPEEITQGIIKILNDEAYRISLCNKGLERSKQFSWRNMAKDYLKLYELMHSENAKSTQS